MHTLLLPQRVCLSWVPYYLPIRLSASPLFHVLACALTHLFRAETFMAHLAADLAVTLEDDRPGMLAKAIGCVSAAGINIDGYSEMNGVVHVLATDLPATR